MSLKIRRRDNKWCVVDIKNDGAQETLGCHDTPKEAIAQRRAIGMRQREVATKPAAWVHQCIRRYRAQGLSQEEAAQRCYGAWHRQHPGQSTRRCLSCEDTVKQLGVAEFYRDIVDEIGKWSKEDANYHMLPPDTEWKEHCRACEFFQNEACELVEGEISENGTCELWLASEGKELDIITLPRLMLLITSNAYQDRDGEWITEKALANYVKQSWEGEPDNSRFVGKNTLLYRHRGEPIGDIVWAKMYGPFLVEVARERLTAKARKRWDLIERAKRMGWGASHGFNYLKDDKNGGVYKRILKFETSVLPLSIAANMFTYAGIVPK